VIARLAQICDEAGALEVAADARALAGRVARGLFHLAVVGQFKRGKSTLVNALIGEALLPVGIVPVTAIVTIVRYAPHRAAFVRLRGGTWREIDPTGIAAYVAEHGNPENEKGVEVVEAHVPSPLLASGMCLVDTPGLGSVFLAGSAATREFLPQVDAALVVLGADPPISEEEAGLVEALAEQVPQIVFVLNKADRVGDAELREVAAFTRQVLSRRAGLDAAELLLVSAAERLSLGRDTRDWSALRERLVRLADSSGRALVEGAARRGFLRLEDRLRRELEEERAALLRPVDESRRRLEALRSCVSDAERAMGDLGHLLTAEQDRLRRSFLEQKDGFLERTLPDARAEFSSGVHAMTRRGPRLRHAAIELAQQITRRWLDRWRVEAQPPAEALYRAAVERFVGLANELLQRLAASGEPALAILPRRIEPELGFRVKSGIYLTSLWSATEGRPLRWLVDLLRSHAANLRAVEREVGRYLEKLLYTNATRVENDFNDRVLESRRMLEREIRSALYEVATSAERGLERAQAVRAAGEPERNARLLCLDALVARLDALAAGDRGP
jgi:GTP-binding protein EngB required for normal cell division